VARAYEKALARARSLIYVEDQYLWSVDIARVLAKSLRNSPQLRLIALVPRYPDRNGLVSGPLNSIGQMQAVDIVRRAGGDRVGIYDIENEAGHPIYVHAKVCVIDDVWVAVGSDNLNRRSWTHDSEVSCAVLDPTRDARDPVDPAGLGDGARALPRDLRLVLWREHLGPEMTDAALLDPVVGFETWRRLANSLDHWHAGGCVGPRPPGRVRSHDAPRLGPFQRLWARPLYQLAIDPDGRPPALKRSARF
jgi:phosphatidylserine/phosphatidylglycerophosphate/cardiolipin synthase-like enzyme